jgi:hypothetical protein
VRTRIISGVSLAPLESEKLTGIIPGRVTTLPGDSNRLKNSRFAILTGEGQQ